MRGWTACEQWVPDGLDVFPAHAGMDRHPAGGDPGPRRVPRACGDGPRLGQISHSRWACSPRMRGWTGSDGHGPAGLRVFPAHAGMDRTSSASRRPRPRVPRACGDGPSDHGDDGEPMKCSPRMRGWTVRKRVLRLALVVFPAHAGMDRRSICSAVRWSGVPRACGDGPRVALYLRSSKECSPRMRGWTVTDRPRPERRRVFPAHAGMDRDSWIVNVGIGRVPRACGDGPPM